MRFLLWIIVLFALACGVAYLVQHYSGELFISFEGYIYHMNLNTAILALVVLLIVVYIVYKLVHTVWNIPKGINRFSVKYRKNQAEQDLNEAGIAYFEGRFQKVQELSKKILKNKYSENKRALALVLAAKSAGECQDFNARDEFLDQLKDYSEQTQLPRYLMLAESALNQGYEHEVDKNFALIRKVNANLTQLIHLELRQAINQKDTEQILKSIARLKKNGAIGEQEIAENTLFAYQCALDNVKDVKSLKKLLKKMDSKLKEVSLVAKIARKFSELGVNSEAISWIKKYYPVSQNPQLLTVLTDCFPYLKESEQSKIMEQAESWLKTSPDNETLLFSLGKMAYLKQLWGKAQGYLEASISIKPTVATHITLAKVFHDADNEEQAEKHQKAALDLIEASQD